MTISDNLKQLRKKINLSQKEFADKLGINLRTYASYERGERDLSTSVLLNICKTLNISSDVLLGNNIEQKEIAPIKQDRSKVIDRINSLPEEQFEKFAARMEGYLDGLEDQ